MIDLLGELEKLEKMRDKFTFSFPGYISHIRFPKYKNITPGERVDFDFPLTALVGPNGSGKTSVINALYGAPRGLSTGKYWFSTEVDPIIEGDGSPNRFIYGHYNNDVKYVVETRKARVRKVRNGQADPNYWEPTKEATGDDMTVPEINNNIKGRSLDRWNPVSRKVLYINFRQELSAFDKYFYFGKDPVKSSSSKKKKIQNKKDLIRKDSRLLAKVIESNDTSVMYYSKKVAMVNRLLGKEELKYVSYILGRSYLEARVVKHRLFRGEGNLSIIFKTNFGSYSEAFAGSGEVSVTSCVTQVLSTSKGSLVLLDEPEVSLHPGAQERLLAFLAKMCKEKQIQVVFSTHSPHFLTGLPDDAVKTFVQQEDGYFSVIEKTHPYAAFHRLGVNNIDEIIVLVEDRLAQSVVQQAILLIDDEAIRGLFKVEYLPGGASAILSHRIPVVMENKGSILVLLDGDQKKGDIPSPASIPEMDDDSLDDIIFEAIGVRPKWIIDGSSTGGNKKQRITAQRKYLQWINDNLKYLPLSTPEEIVLKAMGKLVEGEVRNGKTCKDLLKKLAQNNKGFDVNSEDIDGFGAFALGQNRSVSGELDEIKKILLDFSDNHRLTHE